MAPAIIREDQDELSNPVQPHDSSYVQIKKLNILMVVYLRSLRPLTFLCILCNGRGSGAENHLDLKAVQVISSL